MALSHQFMHLIILPTEQCNFRCTYCYEDFAIGRMQDEIVASILALLDRRAPELSELTISWFGGEPLLAVETIFSVMEHLKGLHFRHISISSDITTNGYRLDSPLFVRMLEANVRSYQISIDGGASHHDRSRILANGRGTFDRIWKNLLDTKKVNDHFVINTRVHVDRDNIAAIESFIADFASEFSGDNRYGLYIRHVSKLGGRNDAALRVLEKAQLQELQALRDLANFLGVRTSKLDEEEYVCYAAKPNSMVVRADGSLAKCTVALSSEWNRVGHIQRGGVVAIDSEKVRVWSHGLSSGEKSEMLCPWNAYVRAL